MPAAPVTFASTRRSPSDRTGPQPGATSRPRGAHFWRAGVTGFALAAAVALGAGTLGAGGATAAPPTLPSPETLEIGAAPLDSALAQGVRTLKAAGADKIALQAAETVKNSLGQISPDQITSVVDQTPLGTLSSLSGTQGTQVAATDPLALLSAAGIQTFTPSLAPFCTAPTADNPLGLVTAGAGAVSGPWPMKTEPTTGINQILAMIPGAKQLEPFNLVEAGETGYAFVPATAATGGKMQVAWFNTSTLKGGFADLEAIPGAEGTLLTKFFPALGAIRLAPVKTGSGTVLSAIYGTAQNGDRTCYFLPAVGVVNSQ